MHPICSLIDKRGQKFLVSTILSVDSFFLGNIYIYIYIYIFTNLKCVFLWHLQLKLEKGVQLVTPFCWLYQILEFPVWQSL